MITTLAVLALTSRFGVTRIPGGPSALVFSILYNYSRVVPSVYRYRIMGVTFTDKLNMYIIALAVSPIPVSFRLHIESSTDIPRLSTLLFHPCSLGNTCGDAI